MTRVFFTLVTVLIFSIAGMSQNASASGKGEATLLLQSGANIEGQLQKTLDVKNAKVGDEVVLKTTKAVKENGQTIVPKGSKLLGRVTELQKRTKSNNASRLGLIFDRLEGGKLSSDITASIVSITNVSAGALSATNDADLFGSSSTTTRSSGSASSGGLLGGGLPAGGVLSTVGNTVGSTLNTGTATLGSVANAATGTAGSTTGPVFRTVDGIQITPAVTGSASSSSTLEAKGRDIRLEKGAAIQLHVTTTGKEE